MTASPAPAPDGGALRREVGAGGAVLLGLGSILGTGVFVSLAIAAGVAGAWVLPAILLAGAVAALNGLSSAQLAAAYPVSGGTYEYGYRLLGPRLGFLAGWLFLAAKSASAATAALGCAGYLLRLAGVDEPRAVVPLALALAAAVTGVVLGGIRRSNRVNAVVVSLTLASLGALVLAAALRGGAGAVLPAGAPGPELLEAAALMFVAFTGYGRIATLGEEVREPRRTIPRAVVGALVACTLLYLAVGASALVALGGAELGQAARSSGGGAPLAAAARRLGVPGLDLALTLGAVTAMVGVILNLVLGLSRVALAMGRRADLPRGLARVSDAGSPTPAIVLVGAVICGLTLIGSVKTAWSFSAFTVLVYYGITNLAALRLPAELRLFPRWTAALGLVGCLGLAPCVERPIWAAGGALIAVGLVWSEVARRMRRGEQAGSV
ncbi:MAG: APC family permease [Planctomycetota bacterium]